jgi:phosphate-selective porin OprO/OprP
MMLRSLPWRALIISCLALLALCPNPLAASDPELAELRARVQKLEEQNAWLMQQLQKGAVPGQARPVQDEPTEGQQPVAVKEEPGAVKEKPIAANEDKVREMVKELLETKEKEKAEAAARKKEADPWYEVGTDLGMTGEWKNAAWLSTPNKDFQLRLRGRIQQDWAWFAPDQELQPRGWHDGAHFRRARLGAQGVVWDIFKFTSEWDFADASGIAGAKDIYMDITHLPWVGNFRAGHFYEPVALENYGTSDLYITFMERAGAIDSFDPDRNIGVMLYNDVDDGLVTWAAGFFRPNSTANGSAVDSGDGEYAYTGRVTFTPWYANEGRCVFMVGGAASYRSLPEQRERVTEGPLLAGLNNTARFRTRIPLRINGTTQVNAERVIDTGALVVDSVGLLNAQALLIYGPLSVQSEYFFVQVNDAQVQNQLINPNYSGFYVQVSYYLTGEHRRYQRSTATIGRPSANEPFFLVESDPECGKRILFGRGAWELAARYDYVDLGNSFVTSQFQGRMQDVVLGVNWLMNSNFRMQFNYVIADVTGLDTDLTNQSGIVHAFGTRFQWDW